MEGALASDAGPDFRKLTAILVTVLFGPKSESSGTSQPRREGHQRDQGDRGGAEAYWANRSFPPKSKTRPMEGAKRAPIFIKLMAFLRNGFISFFGLKSESSGTSQPRREGHKRDQGDRGGAEACWANRGEC